MLKNFEIATYLHDKMVSNTYKIVRKIVCHHFSVLVIKKDHNIPKPVWWLYSKVAEFGTLIAEGDRFKVHIGVKKILFDIDIEMYLTILDNILANWNCIRKKEKMRKSFRNSPLLPKG